MRRSLKSRVEFWKPQMVWFGWKTLLPVQSYGVDEQDWHCVVIGWPVTGRILVSTRPCPGPGVCAGSDPIPDFWNKAR